ESGTATPRDERLGTASFAVFLPVRPLRSPRLSQSSDRRLGHEWATITCLNRQQEMAMKSSTLRAVLRAAPAPTLLRRRSLSLRATAAIPAPRRSPRVR